MQMSSQSKPFALCGDDKETRSISTQDDIGGSLQSYALISKFYNNQITATVIALFNPASHHHWISLTLAMRFLNGEKYKPAMKCDDCGEVGLAVGMIELEWSCHRLGRLGLRNKFLISEDGQFNILFGQEEEYHSIPFQIMQSRQALRNGHFLHKDGMTLPVDLLEFNEGNSSEESSMQEALREGLLVQVEEATPGADSMGPSLEEVSAKLDCFIDSTIGGTQSSIQSSQKPPNSISTTTSQTSNTPPLTEESDDHSYCFSEATEYLATSDNVATPCEKSDGDPGRVASANRNFVSLSGNKDTKEGMEREEVKSNTLDSGLYTSSKADFHYAPSEITTASTITLNPSIQRPEITHEPRISEFQQLFKKVDNFAMKQSHTRYGDTTEGSAESTFLSHNVVFRVEYSSKASQGDSAVDEAYIPKLIEFLSPDGSNFTHDPEIETRSFSSVNYAHVLLKSDKLLSMRRWLRSDMRNERVAVALLSEEDVRKGPGKSLTWPIEQRTRTAYKTLSDVTQNIAPPAAASWTILPTATPEEIDEILRLKKEDKYLQSVAEKYWTWSDDHQSYYHDTPSDVRLWYGLPPGKEPPVVRKH